MNESRVLRAMEVVATIAIVASVLAVAIPKQADVQRRDTAQQVLDDVEVVRQAVFKFYSDSAYFPPEAAGAIPENLAPYLPPSFMLRRRYGTLEYHNWPMPQQEDSVKISNVLGVTVVTDDPKVGLTAVRLAPTSAHFRIGRRETFLIFGS